MNLLERTAVIAGGKIERVWPERGVTSLQSVSSARQATPIGRHDHPGVQGHVRICHHVYKDTQYCTVLRVNGGRRTCEGGIGETVTSGCRMTDILRALIYNKDDCNTIGITSFSLDVSIISI